MNLNNLEKILEAEPKYRLSQAKSAVFKELIEDWAETSILPSELRQQLNKNCPLSIKAETTVSKTEDVAKARITLEDGLEIESALMRHSDGRNTVCVSSQTGCPLDCQFCATGKMGFKRNLKPLEIVEQAIFFARRLKKESERITNAVFMGMGEPLLNYENVMTAITILNDKNGLNIGARHISVSTIGIIEGIKKLAAEKIQLNLAISLHAPNNKLRDEIIPINKKYPIEMIISAVDNYIAKTNRQVMFEYLLIKGVNDSDACARELAGLMKKPLYFLNLISYNPSGVFQASTPERTENFKSILKEMGVKFSQRYKFGQDISAACGQFAIK
ncbi:23S rRNA (adenine(2503)-C(2))-methyltransferase [Candidatus Jorgensenbacteria bacterium RIFCSPLOWO2_12_FULL_42_11]|uniref:23S rRNA (Adenine(2503)-C(2))-methyltransferase n=1 Tax=Candidatus Jorgensenbacteria bacterium RIFCSPLOWO2_12_FULL_42_11 TaxID=1798473 RepID=A0A1F6C3C7_9BACT|nr:MAG: 23S rRNA (adenine(2503)-C(2))-methyltransferase [Candidatus Jorgensenbacteria bacterium RIFCSPLOWO2_12_FULL_42_11]